jgi:hypothetical protein
MRVVKYDLVMRAVCGDREVVCGDLQVVYDGTRKVHAEISHIKRRCETTTSYVLEYI